MGYDRHNAPPILSRYISDENGCWIFQGQKNIEGYGIVQIGQARDGNRTRQMAHRYFYEQIVGPIPDDLLACHKCDNPPCVNPDHMFIGTQADNIADMMKKGRRGKTGAKGSLNGRAIVTENQVKEIRDSSAARREVAAQYGISPVTVGAIKARRIWKHIR